MYTKLAGYLQRPLLYEKTATLFWNDPHIATQMLKAHLDPTSDAASRRPEFIQASVEWLASLLPPGSAILDIGCGPGLYTKPLAQRGYQVTGMDFSPNSIAYAKEQDSLSCYLLQDYLTMDFTATFEMITLIWCDFGALVPEERQELLARVYRGLKPGGIFVLDCHSPELYRDEIDGTTWELAPQGGFWSLEPYLLFRGEYFYDSHIGVSQNVVVTASQVCSYHIWHTCFTPETLLAECSPHGFTLAAHYGDVAGASYDASSPVFAVLLQK
ncbi:MAG: class I SAM-dependent methyltransferase [Symbiobacteriaceae bacterium]|nr:class I SAM-dependent methyltransferase [Symbiobacteriaceae bacterium]